MQIIAEATTLHSLPQSLMFLNVLEVACVFLTLDTHLVEAILYTDDEVCVANGLTAPDSQSLCSAFLSGEKGVSVCAPHWSAMHHHLA